jgi:hypothetical protein
MGHELNAARDGVLLSPRLAKLDVLNGRLAGTLAYYHITKENVLNPDPLRPTFQVQTSEERGQGVEHVQMGHGVAWSTR